MNVGKKLSDTGPREDFGADLTAVVVVVPAAAAAAARRRDLGA
jgi:hypothetical protein